MNNPYSPSDDRHYELFKRLGALHSCDWELSNEDRRVIMEALSVHADVRVNLMHMRAATERLERIEKRSIWFDRFHLFGNMVVSAAFVGLFLHTGKPLDGFLAFVWTGLFLFHLKRRN